ncbi:hypothetical protein HTZ84_00010 [Haloterrigena sp. SYSU A558-1]|uniref:Uncharacterized protein n=1 Tax=Haloterrigena gelatinilytica TaxID=2741724 RepID=A0ABX2L853_9EURY|nr:hypothetical protein [Haloterrigena gelatinilytica]NUC70710.1 hypothetical protein [Haloterrigena gelatinilytica]
MSNKTALARKLDLLDLEILAVLTHTSMWKKKLHETLEKKSVQTIGRRVEQLQTEDLLESCIVNPDEVKRDLIIAYQTTASGREILKTYHICTSPDCDAIVVDGEDHVHEFSSAVDYFDAATSS